MVGQYFNFVHLGRQGYCQRMASLEAIACHLADGLAAMEPLRLVSHPRGQLPVFAVECDPSIKNWTVFHLSKMMRSRGWQVPAYTLPANLQDRAVLRFVIRAGFNQDMADQLLADVQRNLAWLATAQTPLPSSSDELGFRH